MPAVLPFLAALPYLRWPIGLAGAVVVTLLASLTWWWWGRPIPRTITVRATVIIAIVTLARVVLGIVTPDDGWLARYYVNDRFAEPYEASTDFPGLGGTRIDRAIDFDRDTFPAHFLNHLRFELPAGRSQLYVEQPLSMTWTGFVHAEAPRQERIALSARGEAWLSVDGVERMRVTTLTGGFAPTTTIDLTSGSHRVDVFYVKPAGVPGHVAVTRQAAGAVAVQWGVPDVVAYEDTPRKSATTLRAGAWALHAGVLLTLLWYASAMVRATRSAAAEPSRFDRRLYAAILTGFAVQGVFKAAERVNRVFDLTSGDDWFGFEARARDLLINGPLMTLGAPIGQGNPFFYYPLYSYFAAGVHRLVGEDGGGVVFAQFMVLALTTIVVHRLARELFDARIALVSVLFFITIEQLAFVRYYTVTMLADNLYVLPVAAAVYVLTRYARTGSPRTLAFAGALVGVAALTKPSMVMFVPLSLAFIARRAYVAGRETARPVRHCAIYFLAALAVISLATIRNVIVARTPVLITAGQADTFVRYSLPPDVIAGEAGLAAFEPSLTGSAVSMMRMFAAHPIDYLRWNGRKVLFSLGFVHLAQGYRPHPELLLAIAGYLFALIMVPEARAPAAWPAHLFVLSHLATMVLTLPWVYGYRLILPVYLFAPIFASAAGITIFDRLRVRTAAGARSPS